MPNFKQLSGGGNRSRITSRLPVVTSTHINAFSGASISNYSGVLKNCIISRYAGEPDRLYATQRPSITVFDDASTAAAPLTKGRGIYWWTKANAGAGARYFVNDTAVYKGSYATICTVANVAGTDQTALISGTERVYFVEWSSSYNDYLFIINPEDNQIFVIQATNVVTGSSGTLGDDDIINVADVISGIGTSGTGDPFHASETFDFTAIVTLFANSLAHGAVVLNKYLFLGHEKGVIFNSTVDSFLTWPALNFLTAERENDKLLVIEESMGDLVAIGERTTEFMYDAGNATGSPLSPRKDIYHSIGAVSEQTVWRDGDDLYILGMKPHGDFSLFIITNRQLKEIHDETINSYLKHGRSEANLYAVMSGFSSGSHTYAILTIENATSDVPQKSIVYDSHSELWYEWSTALRDLTYFSVIDFANRTSTSDTTLEGIWHNGDLFSIADNFSPVDKTTVTGGYFAEDYESADYDAGTGNPVTSNITAEIIIGNIELDSTDRKFMHNLKYVGNPTKTTQNLTVEWTDDDEASWYSGTIGVDLQNRTQINRLGSFERRKFRLSFDGDEQIRMEAIDVTYTQGSS